MALNRYCEPRRLCNRRSQQPHGRRRQREGYGDAVSAIPVLHISRKLAITLADHAPDNDAPPIIRGFPTDGASLPLLVQWRWSPWEPRIFNKAVRHDAGYSLHDIQDGWGSKCVVDDRFKRELQADGFEASKLFWSMVHNFGGSAWNKSNIPEIGNYWFAVQNNLVNEWIDDWKRAVDEFGGNSEAIRKHVNDEWFTLRMIS